MPPWLPRAFVLAVATVALFAAGLWVLARLRGLLLLVLIALFLALAIEPAVNRLAARGWRRGLATGLMFLGLGLLLTLFFSLLGSLLIGQITTIGHEFPSYAQHVVTWVNNTFHTKIAQSDVSKPFNQIGRALSGHLTQLAGNAWGIGASVFGVVFQTFAVLLFAFYLSAEGPRVRRGVCSLLPPDRQREILRAWEIAVEKTGGYIYSRVLLALASAVAHGIALFALRVPFAFALAIWVGVVSQLVPTIGTYLAGVLPVLVALTKGPFTALWVLAFIIAYQQFENYVLQPHITARTVDIHPAVAFGAVIGGAALIGPLGALLAIPAWASIQSFASAYIRRYEVEEHPLTEPDEPAKPERHRLPWRRHQGSTSGSPSSPTSTAESRETAAPTGQAGQAGQEGPGEHGAPADRADAAGAARDDAGTAEAGTADAGTADDRADDRRDDRDA